MGFSKLNDFAKKMLFNAEESICILNKFLAILSRLDQSLNTAVHFRSFQEKSSVPSAAFCSNINNFLSFVHIEF